MELMNGYWIDENNNRWDSTFYTAEVAQKFSESLKNCRNCVNSRYCQNCESCSYCGDCKDCRDCKACRKCTGCQKCTGCWDCEDCQGRYDGSGGQYLILDLRIGAGDKWVYW